MCMTLEQYERQLFTALLHYGFTSNPISDDVESLYVDNVSIDDAYAIACDVAAGFTITESRAAMGCAA